MEAAIRKTARLKNNGEFNPVGEVIVRCPDGHPWSANTVLHRGPETSRDRKWYEISAVR